MTEAQKAAEEAAEEYGQRVMKHRVSKMPPKFLTNELPKWDGSSDFTAKSGFLAGADWGYERGVADAWAEVFAEWHSESSICEFGAWIKHKADKARAKVQGEVKG